MEVKTELLLAPSLLFLAVFFALPALTLILYSVLTQAADGAVGLPLTPAHYQHFFTIPVYSRVLLTTLQISLWTTAAAALLAYPVARGMVRSTRFLRQAITMIVIAPADRQRRRAELWLAIDPRQRSDRHPQLAAAQNRVDEKARRAAVLRGHRRHRLAAHLLSDDGLAGRLGARTHRPEA